MSHVTRIVTADRIFANPGLIHRAEHEALIHLHNLNLSDEEDFDDFDNELEGLEVVEIDAVFVDFADHVEFDPLF